MQKFAHLFNASPISTEEQQFMINKSWQVGLKLFQIDKRLKKKYIKSRKLRMQLFKNNLMDCQVITTNFMKFLRFNQIYNVQLIKTCLIKRRRDILSWLMMNENHFPISLEMAFDYSRPNFNYVRKMCQAGYFDLIPKELL